MKVILWTDVPVELRADETYWRHRGGAQPKNWHGWGDSTGEELAEKWVQKNLAQTLHREGMCGAAFKVMPSETQYRPCSHKVDAGETLCFFHGGPKRQKRSKGKGKPMKAIVVSHSLTDVTIVSFTEEFKEGPVVNRLDILKDAIHDLTDEYNKLLQSETPVVMAQLGHTPLT